MPIELPTSPRGQYDLLEVRKCLGYAIVRRGFGTKLVWLVASQVNPFEQCHHIAFYLRPDLFHGNFRSTRSGRIASKFPAAPPPSRASVWYANSRPRLLSTRTSARNAASLEPPSVHLDHPYSLEMSRALRPSAHALDNSPSCAARSARPPEQRRTVTSFELRSKAINVREVEPVGDPSKNWSHLKYESRFPFQAAILAQLMSQLGSLGLCFHYRTISEVQSISG